jgi:DNA-binding response OmpR family regulator
MSDQSQLKRATVKPLVGGTIRMWKTPKGQPKCIVVLSPDDARRQEVEASLNAIGFKVYSVATAADALVVVLQDGCDVLIADVAPGAVPLHEAAGVLSYVRAHHRSVVRGIALAGDAAGPTSTSVLSAGFEAVIDPIAGPDAVAQLVERLSYAGW